ncbi:MAG: PHP domain-containing protein [Clostridiales Family XIII bacterium]|jgi:hypothetical protein|nr:PHP domain-containing protein [Clostridiales Family XIII bacterium]
MSTYEDNYKTALELSQDRPEKRLAALKNAYERRRAEERSVNSSAEFVNNHIHSIYSFSPYSPTAAACAAKRNGLTTAGIMDHDSVAGAWEFLEACKITGVAATVGFECRVKMDHSPFVGRRINNPDQNSIAYMACHGIPHQNIEKAQKWLKPYRESRALRDRLMVERLNKSLSGSGIDLDFKPDVEMISQFKSGGVITERHILFALALKISKRFGRGKACLEFLTDELSLPVGEKTAAALLNPDDPIYEYHLLGVLKAHLVKEFYIDANDECPDVFEFLEFVKSIGAISAYPYLGDVTDSITGDKKSNRFEDEYLEELIDWLVREGFNAVTYMPARNSLEQLQRLMRLSDAGGLFQISGEDINAPTQSFICEMLAQPAFRHLVDSTWALIGHEKAASVDQSNGMFSSKAVQAMPDLKERIAYFGKKGRS